MSCPTYPTLTTQRRRSASDRDQEGVGGQQGLLQVGGLFTSITSLFIIILRFLSNTVCVSELRSLWYIAGENKREEGEDEDLPVLRKGRHGHLLQQEGDTWRRVSRSAPKDNYALIDAYGRHGWVEGPELEDYCR